MCVFRVLWNWIPNTQYVLHCAGAEFDGLVGEDDLVYAEERIEEDEELKLFALSNQANFKRFL